MNDGGCDLDVEELRTILGDVPLDYHRLEKNMGRAHAGNVGIKNSKGRYIGFLDDDDELYPDHVSGLLSFLTGESNYAAVYSDSEIVEREYDDEGRIIKENNRGLFKSWDFSREILLFENYIPLMCSLLGKELLDDIGGFDESFELYEDWDLFIRASQKGPFYHIRKVTTKYIQWSRVQQIAFINWPNAREYYLKVLLKHSDEITPEVVYKYFLVKQEEITRMKDLFEEAQTQREEARIQQQEAHAFLKEESSENIHLKHELKHAMALLKEESSKNMDLKHELKHAKELLKELSSKNINIEYELKQMSILQEELKDNKRQIQVMQERFDRTEKQMRELRENSEKQIRELQENNEKRLQPLQAELGERRKQVQMIKEELLMKNAYIEEVQSGIGWMILDTYRKNVKDRLVPLGTKRRTTYNTMLKGIKILKENGLRTLLGKVRRQFRETKASGRVTREFFVSPKVTNTSVASIDTTISVVIPTKNAGPDFRFVLEKIKRQKGIKKDIDIIVVDSGSDDDTIRLAKQYKTRVFSIPRTDFGHGRTRNFGASHAICDYIVFLSQDAIPIGDTCFVEMVRGMENDKRIAAVSVKQIPRSDADLFACWQIWNHYRNFLGYSKDAVVGADHRTFDSLGPDDRRRVAQIDNIFSCIRKNIFDQFTFNDLNYAEDLDLGLRLVRQGYKVGFLSSVGAIHSHNRDTTYYFKRSYVDRKALIHLLNFEPVDWRSVGIESLAEMVDYARKTYCKLAYAFRQFDQGGTRGRAGLSLVNSLHQLVRAYDPESGDSGKDVNLSIVMDKLAALSGSDGLHVSVSRDVLMRQFFSILESFEEYLSCYEDMGGTEELVSAMHKLCAVVLGSNVGDYIAFCGDQKGAEQALRMYELLGSGV